MHLEAAIFHITFQTAWKFNQEVVLTLEGVYGTRWHDHL